MFHENQRMGPYSRSLLHSRRREGGGNKSYAIWLMAPTSLSFRLEFPCSKNVVEYEALVIMLIFTLQIGIRRLRLQRDSKLVIRRSTESFPCLLSNPRPKACEIFQEHSVQAHPAISQQICRHVSNLSIKVDISDETIGVNVIRKALGAIPPHILFLLSLSIIQNLLWPSSTETTKKLKDSPLLTANFIFKEGEVSYRAVSES